MHCAKCDYPQHAFAALFFASAFESWKNVERQTDRVYRRISLPIFISVLAVMVLSAGLGMESDPERSIALSLSLGLPALILAILFL